MARQTAPKSDGEPPDDAARWRDGRVVRAVVDIASPRLCELWTYWRSLHRAEMPPGRADIDPLAIPQLLPFVMLVDVQGDPPDFRYRLVGTHITQIHRADNTGRRVADAFAGREGDAVLRFYRRVVAERATIAHRGRPVRRDGRVLDYEIIHMPLVDGRGSVNMILVGLEFTIRP